MSYSPWILRLSSIAADCSPQQGVEHLRQHANHLGITLIGDVNGTEYMAVPGNEPTPLPKVNPAAERPAENRADGLKIAAQHLDECLLRCFDAGMLDQAIEDGCCGIDTWGSLADFRSEFGLPPTMSAAEWAEKGGQVYPCIDSAPPSRKGPASETSHPPNTLDT